MDYLRYLLEFERSGAAAALVTRGFVDLETLVLEDLLYLGERFLKGENRGPLVKIGDELRRRGESPSDEGAAFTGSSVGMEKLLEGTVTVWVDRGLKVEKGVGQLDRSIGSGFFVDKKGYILTNYHVISSEVDPEYKGFSRLYIKLSDDRGEKIPARVVGWDRHFDVALLKTEIEAPYVFSFASDDEFELGEKIFAIGSPGGLNNTITSGTVSALRRPLQTMGETIQIDVPINPGNSGGPLMNSDSEVTGIVFAGIEDFEGVNFAINGSYVKKLLPALYEGGELKHSWMGIGGYHGYRILESLYIMPDSPAEKAGLQRGDRIVSVNGIPVGRSQQVRDILLDKMPGTLVRLEWESEGETRSSVLSLGLRPDIPLEEASRLDVKENLIPPVFGMVLSSVGRNQYTVEKVYTGGSADEASISANDVILIRKWFVNKKDGFFLIQFNFKGVKAGYLESAVQMGAGMESSIFF
jgi:S1-C subfamily serine protease